MVFGITINPFDTLVASVEDYAESNNKPSDFGSEIHDFNNIDYKQFANGYDKYDGSQEFVSK